MMRRYRFRIFDGHGLVDEERQFQATNNDVAIRLAEGWRDHRAAEVLHANQRIKRWN
jgi:hypothetical protein